MLRIKGSASTPRKALAPLSPNIGACPQHASATPGRAAPSSATFEASASSDSTMAIASTSSKPVVASLEATVQADLAPAPHVCCHMLLETAVRERDAAQEQLRMLKDVTDEVVEQAGRAASRTYSTGTAEGADAEDKQELRRLLARAQAAIASERVEHSQLQSKYKLAVKRVVELKSEMQASQDNKGLTSTQAGGATESKSCQTPRGDDGGMSDEERAKWKAMLQDSDNRLEPSIPNMPTPPLSAQ